MDLKERWFGFDSHEDISGIVIGRNIVLDASSLVKGNRVLARLEDVYEKVFERYWCGEPSFSFIIVVKL